MTKEPETKSDPFRLRPPSKGMKAFSTLVFFLLGLALGAFIFWNPFEISFLPSGAPEPAREAEPVLEARTETAELWTCPMHPEVVEKEPGTCPICHMKLVPLEQPQESAKDGPEPAVTTETAQLWTCPMHPEVVEQEPGICPICNMKLVPLKPSGGPGAEPPVRGERKVLYWQAPMDPNYISETPGKSPMGMDLVPVYADEGTGGASDAGAVNIDPAIVQQIGVRSEAVRLGELRPVIRTVGILDYNEEALFLVTTKFEGWIEDVYVNYVGQEVKKGQRLFSIYSPELVSTQEEYLAALSFLKELEGGGSQDAIRSARRLVDAATKRLAYWDITESQVRNLERSGKAKKSLTVVAPATGVVIRKMDAALEGMYVKAGMNLYEIADLSTVWVHADLYESQLAWVKPGLEAEITLSAFPGETFSGKVLYLYPYVSEKTRTMRACIEIRNREGEKVQPGMYADVKFMPVGAQRAVLVPEDAVIRTGERNVVFVDLGGGRFLPREVVLGLKGDGVFEVKEGLAPGERVVVSAQFLLDSESRLQDFIRKLMAGTKEANP